MKFPAHRIIFKGELEAHNANAYTEQLAAQIEPSRHKSDGVLYISVDEAVHLSSDFVKKIHNLEKELGLCGIVEKDRLRIEKLESVLDAVVNRYENVGSGGHFGVSLGIYKICKDALNNKETK